MGGGTAVNDDKLRGLLLVVAGNVDQTPDSLSLGFLCSR